MNNLDEIKRLELDNQVKRFKKNLVEQQIRSAFYAGIIQGFFYSLILFSFISILVVIWI